MFVTPRYVDSLAETFFYHTMELPGFGVVPGQWDLRGKFDDYVGNIELASKSVLDVGTATGFLSFEAEKRGAARVVSFDMEHGGQFRFLPFKDSNRRDSKLGGEDFEVELERWKNAYWLAHRLLQSKAEVFYGDIYDLPLGLGLFDVAVIGSVLEHLSDPISALASIARVTNESVVVVTPLLESEEPVARFEGRADHPESDFTWWTYSVGLYREVFKMLGFDIQRITSAEYYYQYLDRFETRWTIVATRS